MKKAVILGFILMLMISIVSAVNYDFLYNPYTARQDRSVNLNQSGNNITADWFFGKINWSDVQNKFITAVDNIYIYMSGTTATFNTTKAGTSLAVNSSDHWGDLDTTSDINAGDITDDNTYARVDGETFTGDVNGTDAYFSGTATIGTLDVTDYGLAEDDIPTLSNRTLPYCGNITGAVSNLCILVDTNETPRVDDLVTENQTLHSQIDSMANLSESDVNTSIDARTGSNGSTAWITPEDISDIDYENICSGDTCPFAWNISGTDVFPQDLSWYVGIGTATPSHELNVVGDVNVTGDITAGEVYIPQLAGNPSLTLDKDNAGTTGIYFRRENTLNDFHITQNADEDVVIANLKAARPMSIGTNDGDITIDAGTGTLTLNNDLSMVRNKNILLHGNITNANDNDPINLLVDANDNIPANDPIFRVYQGGGVRFTVDAEGDINATGDIFIEKDLPFMNFRNPTPSNADWERRSAFKFYGTKADSTDHILATMTVGHDGALDDYQGKIKFLINDGNDASPSRESLVINEIGATGRRLALPNGVAPSELRYINIVDVAINTAADRYGIYTSLAKTAGNSINNDEFMAGYFATYLDQPVGAGVDGKGETGRNIALFGSARLGEGNIGDVGVPKDIASLYFWTNLDDGIVWKNAIGMHAEIDQEAANEVRGDSYVASLKGDFDGTNNGTTYMLYLDENTGVDYGIYQSGTADNYFGGKLGIGIVPVATRQLYVNTPTTITTDIYGIHANIQKSFGASDISDDLTAGYFYSKMTDYNQEIGAVYGLRGYAHVARGIVGAPGSNRAVAGLQFNTQVDDYGALHTRVYGSARGLSTTLDLNTGVVITGDGYGAYILADNVATVSGNVYMLYLDEGTGIDYGIYQDGTADNYFGGKVGIGTATPAYPLDIKASVSNQDMFRLSHPTSPTNAGFILGFNTDGTTNDNVISLGVEYSSADYDVINIQRSTRNVGIGTTTPSYPLEINGDTSGISLYVSANMSSTGYNTRTSVYDKTKGSALDYIQDSDYYLTDGEIDHEKFYSFAGEFEVSDYDKPVIEYYNKSVCDLVCVPFNRTEKECNETIINETEIEECWNVIIAYEECEEVCVDEVRNRTTYPYNKIEKSISLNAEIDVLRQAIFELKEENIEMRKRVEVLEDGK